MKLKIESTLAILTLAAGVMTSCGKQQQQTMPTANFETTTVETSDLTLDNKFSATIRGRQDIDVYPQVSGTLQKLCVTEGQKVSKGQTLFIIDQVPYQAALNTAEASLKAAQAQLSTAELNYNSKKKLYEQSIISDFDVKNAENSVLTAKAQIAQCQAAITNAKNNLSYTVVKAPSAGVVGTLPYRQGALVGPSMPQALTTVSDNSQMYVYFSINETALLEMARQHDGNIEAAIAALPKVKLQLVDGTTYDQMGTVESVSGVVDRTTGTVQLRACFDNPQHLLHSGSTGNVLMPVTYTNQIIIPTTATVQTQDKYKVYVVDDKNIAHETIITISEQTDGEKVVVTGGLKAGQKIVAKGAGMLKDGQNVKPNKEEEKK